MASHARQNAAISSSVKVRCRGLGLPMMALGLSLATGEVLDAVVTTIDNPIEEGSRKGEDEVGLPLLTPADDGLDFRFDIIGGDIG